MSGHGYDPTVWFVGSVIAGAGYMFRRVLWAIFRGWFR